MVLSSVERVRLDTKELGLDVQVVELAHSTRTAQEAAQACGCNVGQIIKSMVFERADDGTLLLVLVSGVHNADLKFLRQRFGCRIRPANPEKVRAQTGFVVGGVSPVGHLTPIPVFMDAVLLGFDRVWAAAGHSSAVFRVDPAKLQQAIGAQVIDVTS